MTSQSSPAPVLLPDHLPRSQADRSSGPPPSTEYVAGEGVTDRQSRNPPHPSEGSQHFRNVVVSHEGHEYRMETNADVRSRHLRLETKGNEIKFIAVAPNHSIVIAVLKWKLQDDIFSLYGNEGLPSRLDRRLCSSLQCLGACFVAQLFEEAWDAVPVYAPIAGSDLGRGQFIRVHVTKMVRKYSRGSRWSPDRYSFDSFELSNELVHKGRNDRFLRFLRTVEVIVAQHLYKSGGLRAREVASVIGIPENPSVVNRIYGAFSPTVPTLYGLCLMKFSSFMERFLYRESIGSGSSLYSKASETDPSSDSGSNPEANVDVELGYHNALSDSEDDIGGGGFDRQDSRRESVIQIDSPSRFRCEGTPDSMTDEISVGEKSDPSGSAADLQEPQKHRYSLEKAESGDQTHTVQVTGGSTDLGEASPLTCRDGVRDRCDLSIADIDQYVPPRHWPDTHRRRLHRAFRHRRHEKRFLRHPGYMYSATNDYVAHVAKDLLTFLLVAVTVALSVLTMALDPAREENWFKRIEEGVFVLFSIGIPIILAMQSRLTDNLDLLMPAVSRPVRSLQDFKNMNKGMNKEIFWEQLAKAILVDEDISDLFSFKNACYKRTRVEGSLVMPETAKYSSFFKEVWLFGAEFCVNKLTGKAFRYLHQDQMLLIERQPANLEGVIVHLRRNDKDYRIGQDPGN